MWLRRGAERALPLIFALSSAGPLSGQATDIDIQAREILKLREKLNDILVKHSGQDYDKIAHDTDRDYFMGAYEAKQYGLIDEVLVQKIDAG